MAHTTHPGTPLFSAETLAAALYSPDRLHLQCEGAGRCRRCARWRRL